MPTRLESNIDLTRRLRAWLKNLDTLNDEGAASIAVDVADIITAADKVAELAVTMLSEDVSSPAGADKALAAAAEIEVQLFTELKSHLATLEESWPFLLERLDALTGDQTKG